MADKLKSQPVSGKPPREPRCRKPLPCRAAGGPQDKLCCESPWGTWSLSPSLGFPLTANHIFRPFFFKGSWWLSKKPLWRLWQNQVSFPGRVFFFTMRFGIKLKFSPHWLLSSSLQSLSPPHDFCKNQESSTLLMSYLLMILYLSVE